MKPCPFCGSIQLVVDEDYSESFVCCENCGATGPKGQWSCDAKALWDERIPEDERAKKAAGVETA